MGVLCYRRAIGILGLCTIFALVWFWNFSADDTKPHNLPNVVLWWTSKMMGIYEGKTRYCGPNVCYFTCNRKLLPGAKAVLFYGSSVNYYDMPLPRLPNQVWGLLHEESPRNKPFISFENVLRNFNFTSTFSRYSNVPLTTQYLIEPMYLTSQTYLVSIAQKSRLRQTLAPVVFIHSDCITMSGRDEYVRELMKYIQIDSYGKCLHNRDMPSKLNTDYFNNLMSPDMYRFLGRYKFILSYENAICDDYITEKFWKPLVVGSIPIMFGSPSIRDWEPNEKSVIHISDFASPESLSKFLHELDKDDVKYNTFLRHKYNQIEPITNQRLLREFLMRQFYNAGHHNLFASFECAVCNSMLNMPQNVIQMASKSHYNCSIPVKVPRMTSELNESSVWKGVFQEARCEADVIIHLLELNENYTSDVVDTLIYDKKKQGECTLK